MNIVEMIAGADEQTDSPCKHGNIVESHACYCHNDAEGMPRKCPIWRSYGTSDLTKWKHNPWLPPSPQIQTYYGENDPRNVYVTRDTWPDDGCPGFEPNAAPSHAENNPKATT